MKILWQYLLPHRFISILAHFFANSRVPWLKNSLIHYFLKRHPINHAEMLEIDPYVFSNFNAFFTRALKPECRPIATLPDGLVSPVDGQISQLGRIDQACVFQAKGRYFSTQSLLAEQTELARFEKGVFITLYLAPRDYHRVHMPIDGRLLQMTYVPGQLFSVNSRIAERIPNLFARNERVIALFETPAGKVAVILVGAMIVGSIVTRWAGRIAPCPTRGRQIHSWHYSDTRAQRIELKKGEELGHFQLGSTVIVLLENTELNWEPSLQPQSSVHFGQHLGRFRLSQPHLIPDQLEKPASLELT